MLLLLPALRFYPSIFLKILRRFVGKAVFDRQLIDFPLSHCVCLRILGLKPTLEDLRVSRKSICCYHTESASIHLVCA